MKTPIPEYLAELLESTVNITGGKPADYIAPLADADTSLAAIALATVDGTVYSAGDDEHEFTIQSMSKPFAYAQALCDAGHDRVMETVGVEPSGEAFNEISLEPETGRPLNPMINAGAIATHGLVKGKSESARTNRMLRLYSTTAGRKITLDQQVANAELRSADRNLGLAHLMAARGVLADDPREMVTGYIRQCSANVTVRDLALMAAMLAAGGAHPQSGNQIFDHQTVRQVLSVMTSSGMYDAAGDWLTNVGIPAKSGVAGGIFGVLPGRIGVAVFSPALDEHGNSTRGVELLRRLSEQMDLHLLNVHRPQRAAMRSHRVRKVDGEPTTIYELQGDLDFNGAEAVLHHLEHSPPKTSTVVFDLSRTDEVTDVAARMSAEAAARLTRDGLRVAIIDPDGLLADFEEGTDGALVERWSEDSIGT